MTPVSPLTPLTPWPSQWPAVQVLISRETIISSWMKPTSTSTRCGIVLSWCSLCFTVECISLYYLVHCTCNSTINPCTLAVAEMYVLYHHCTECCPCLVPSRGLHCSGPVPSSPQLHPLPHCLPSIRHGGPSQTTTLSTLIPKVLTTCLHHGTSLRWQVHHTQEAGTGWVLEYTTSTCNANL